MATAMSLSEAKYVVVTFMGKVLKDLMVLKVLTVLK